MSLHNNDELVCVKKLTQLIFVLFPVKRTVRKIPSLSIWIVYFNKHFCILKRVSQNPADKLYVVPHVTRK